MPMRASFDPWILWGPLFWDTLTVPPFELRPGENAAVITASVPNVGFPAGSAEMGPFLPAAPDEGHSLFCGEQIWNPGESLNLWHWPRQAVKRREVMAASFSMVSENCCETGQGANYAGQRS
jgi:hypothetical protein